MVSSSRRRRRRRRFWIVTTTVLGLCLYLHPQVVAPVVEAKPVRLGPSTPPPGVALVSRANFLFRATTSACAILPPSFGGSGLGTPSSRSPRAGTGTQEHHDDDVVVWTFPLRYLPTAGCLALRISFVSQGRDDDDFSYYFGVVDTGSPFLTAPRRTLSVTRDASKEFPNTPEQYGETKGSVSWRYASSLFLGPFLLFQNSRRVVLGIPSENVIEETGGVFVGLIPKDDFRPTLMEQLGAKSFRLNYVNRTLELSNQNFIVAKQDDRDDSERIPNNVMELFDLSPYGTDLYHYGVLCDRFSATILRNNNNNNNNISEPKETTVRVRTKSLKRPVVCVFDTGLTGCVFSDSLWEELDQSRLLSKSDFPRIRSLALDLCSSSSWKTPGEPPTDPTLSVHSDEDHWFLTSFKLPWFDKPEVVHPHIIVLGATFFAERTVLTVDSASGLAKLDSYDKTSPSQSSLL